MTWRSSAFLLLMTGSAVLSGCATKGQVQLLESELRSFRVESARRDSTRAAALAAMLTLQNRIMDSLGTTRQALANVDARLQSDLTEIQRQLIAVQELTGQSQVRLTQLKAQLDARAEQAAVSGQPAAPGDTSARAPGPTADQLYQNARNQHIRGANSTARAGYQQFLQSYRTDPRAADALYYIAETFGEQAP